MIVVTAVVSRLFLLRANSAPLAPLSVSPRSPLQLFDQNHNDSLSERELAPLLEALRTSAGEGGGAMPAALEKRLTSGRELSFAEFKSLLAMHKHVALLLPAFVLQVR